MPMTLWLHIQLNPHRVTVKASLSLGDIYNLAAWPGTWRPLETRPQEPEEEEAGLPPTLPPSLGRPQGVAPKLGTEEREPSAPVRKLPQPLGEWGFQKGLPVPTISLSLRCNSCLHIMRGPLAHVPAERLFPRCFASW